MKIKVLKVIIYSSSKDKKLINKELGYIEY